jgi:Pectate lyase superfamily protein/Secretion system C-terminal sorting domain
MKNITSAFTYPIVSIRGYNKKSILFFFTLLLAVESFCQQTVYPTDLAWNNAVTNFNCVPDGITDNTINLRKAAQTYPNPYLAKIVVYLPAGTYLISDSIELPSTYYDKDIVFLGEDSANTIIKLIDNAPGFQDVNNPRPMVKTREGNQAFGNYFKNITFNTGSGNPGAVGLDYITSNYGAVEHVRIVSPDNNGYAGIIMERFYPGPGLIKNTTIEGHQYGIKVSVCQYSMTMEHIVLKNQKVAGIYNFCNTLSIRKLTTINVPKPVQNFGRMTLLDANLTSDNPYSNYAIENGTIFYGKNINTSGYAGALLNENIPVAGNNISEFTMGQNYSLFPNDGKSLGLPIEETPQYVNNDLTQWTKANSYGAEPSDPNFFIIDATNSIEAALNSGKKVIYFDRIGSEGSYYFITRNIVIPPSVEMITGFNNSRFGYVNNSKFVINSDASSPLFIDGMINTSLLNNSQRTVVLKGSSLSEYINTSANTNGKVFIEDGGVGFKPQFPVRMWARQLDPEVQNEGDTAIINRGGSFWILGLKTEGRACIATTYNGGKTEILGAAVYPVTPFTNPNEVAFKVKDACMSITTLSRISYSIPRLNAWFGISVQETQNGVTQNFITPFADPEFFNVPFFSTSKISCTAVVLPITLKNISAFCNQDEITLQWVVENETDIKSFLMQTSVDGINWVDEKGVEANKLQISYKLSTLNRLNMKYVRLSTIELNGKRNYNNVIKLNCNDLNSFVVYPNPFTETVTINIPKNNSNKSLLIKDINGKIVHQQKLGSNNSTVNLEMLAAGTYFAEIIGTGDKNKRIKRIVKVK